MAIMRMLTMEGPGPFVGLGGSQDAGLLAGTGDLEVVGTSVGAHSLMLLRTK